MSRGNTADEIKILESELASLENFVRDRSQKATAADVSTRIRELIALQRQEHDDIVRQYIPTLHASTAERAQSRLNVRAEEAQDIADYEVGRWRQFNQIDYWPALQSNEQRKANEASPPPSPRGKSGDNKLNQVYDNEYDRLMGNKVGVHNSLLDKIYGDEYLRLQKLRLQERMTPQDDGSPRNRLAVVQPQTSPMHSQLDNIYDSEYRRLMNMRLQERLSPEHGSASPSRTLTMSPTQRNNDDLERIYGAEYRRLEQLRSQERFGEFGERKSPSSLAIAPRAGENNALDAIYGAEYRRLQALRAHEKLGEYPAEGSKRLSPTTLSMQRTGGNPELERIYGLEYSRQFQQLASKQIQPNSQGSPTAQKQATNDAAALELERALLQHHVKWRRRIASLFQ